MHPYHYLLIALLLASCRPTRPEPPLAAYFQSMPAPDTLRFEISDDTTTAVPGRVIPAGDFYRALPAPLWQTIEHVADTTMAVVTGLRRFALTDSVDAYWVDIRLHWFQHQALLLYDRYAPSSAAGAGGGSSPSGGAGGGPRDLIPVAEWYGGDGGQLLIASYLVDYDGDGDKDLVRREIQHALIVDGDEPRDLYSESALLLEWRNGRFIEQPLTDSSLVAKRFPIRTMW